MEKIDKHVLVFECEYNNQDSSNPNTASFKATDGNLVRFFSPSDLRAWFNHISRGMVACETNGVCRTSKRVKITVELS